MSLSRLKPPPRYNLALTPTPLEPFPLSPAPKTAINIMLKRDDMTSSEWSGNKIRKLEFILYDAIVSRADTLITCGGVNSNHCRVTAALAAKAGIHCHLFVYGRKPALPSGNLLLDTLYGAQTHFVTKHQYDTDIAGIMQRHADKLRRMGRRPYVIPEGASNVLGIWGYLLAGFELKQQLDKAGITANYLVCPVGSGGTYAGLHLAKKVLNWQVKIIGMAVNRDCLYHTRRIMELVEGFMGKYGLPRRAGYGEIDIDDSYIGPGYAKITSGQADFLRGVASNAGVILDPVYTGKAMMGLFDYIVRGKIPRRSNVVFFHTGGLASVFAYARQLLGQKGK